MALTAKGSVVKAQPVIAILISPLTNLGTQNIAVPMLASLVRIKMIV